MLDPDALLERLAALAIIPVVQIDDATQARPLAAALRDGGLPVAEITYRTAAADAAIAELVVDGSVLVGAGSVTNLAQARRAIAAGVTFVVSPGLDREVVRCCQEARIAVIPGVATPTEIMQARSLGLAVLKLFPAEVIGGRPALKALAAPFPDVRFVPTGGVAPDNLADWLREPRVHAVGGSWMVKAGLIDAGNFDEIRRLTSEAVHVRDQIRSR